MEKKTGITGKFLDHTKEPLDFSGSESKDKPTSKTTQSKKAEQVIAMRLLTERQVSAITAVPMGTLRRWRCVGDGPPYIKMGRGPKARVKYDSVDIHQYVEDGRRYPIRAGITGGQHGNNETR